MPTRPSPSGKSINCRPRKLRRFDAHCTANMICNPPDPTRSVTILQVGLPHYRIPFFESLRQRLAREGIQLNLLVSRGIGSQYLECDLEWTRVVKLWNVGPFIIHGPLPGCRRADLIIAPQEVKILVNYLLQFKNMLGGAKFAYWGHGKNFQSHNALSLAERVKRFVSRHVDWWFAYNDLSAGIIRDLGFPAERITAVGNAIDTQGLVARRNSLTERNLDAVRKELHLNSANVAVYTGGLYGTKRIDFLLNAAITIRKHIPDFELIVIGAGPDRQLVTDTARRFPWIHDVGPKNDTDKVPYWALSKVLLMPGGVGLVILDSFALGVPMVTTETRLHGPEIDYLANGENGLLVTCGDSHETYAREVADLLNDPQRLERLRQGALASAHLHTIEIMADNFTAGIVQALSSPRKRLFH